MMTLDEAIKHAEKVARGYLSSADWGTGHCLVDQSKVEDARKRGEECRQLAEWLLELKRFRVRRQRDSDQEGWILVSERLPEDETYVLVSIKVRGREPRVRSGIYYHGLFMNDNGDTWEHTDKRVKAWMASPIPYREEKRDD